MTEKLIVLNHPLLQEKLTILREKSTPFYKFRHLVRELGSYMAYEAASNFKTKVCEVETPLEKTSGVEINEELVLVSIMRAGNALLDGALDTLPTAKVGFLGLQRVNDGKQHEKYYENLPPIDNNTVVIVTDPMVATAGSALETFKIINEYSPKKIIFLNLLMSPESTERIAQAYPDVQTITLSIDREMNSKNYILPGLGDAGDRIYGTL